MVDGDAELRAAALAYVDQLVQESPDGTVPSSRLNDFFYLDRRVRLVVQPGIRTPAGMGAALTIRTTYTPPGGTRPYDDDATTGGAIRYKYRGVDPNHPDNRALRRAMVERVPLIYFVGIAKGVYSVHAPAFVVGEDPTSLEFVIAVGEDQRAVDFDHLDQDTRAYIERLNRQRLHQRLFRDQVLHAYGAVCAMCRLRHRELLDAAHILPDADPSGLAIVPNGLSLCKIHHAAYDKHILGVRPDLVVHVRQDVLEEHDGPMLTHGLQAMHGTTLLVPQRRHDRPDSERLAERYALFRAAG